MTKIRLFIDLDGTAAEWKKIKTLEEIYEKDYFGLAFRRYDGNAYGRSYYGTFFLRIGHHLLHFLLRGKRRQ